MSLFKHPQSGNWWLDFTPPGGKRIKRSTGTTDRKAAQEFHDKLKAESWRVVKLGEQVERLFDDAALEFLKASEGQSDYNTKVRHVTYWRQFFGGKPLRSLTSEAIRAALPTHTAFTDKRVQRKLSAATVNRHIATITRIMTIAHESGWIAAKPKINLREEGGIRFRYIDQAQARALLAAIQKDWLRNLVTFALSTGMRQGEILSLKWTSVNLTNRMCWVNAEDAKSGHGRAIPLNDEALALITSLKGMHKEYVFTRCGHGMDQIDDSMFKRACRKAGIEDFRFHDLRHTWASWHAQAGTPLTKLQALGGWRTIQMVLRYAHLSPVHLTEHVSNVLFTAQPALETEKPPARVALCA
ncbi:XerC Integrase [uncultured Caudovirales phage]|uniref:Integrase n=1 Tax=uncultured Caudovirales phage TaxID=2100421 RepID=A0A6J7W9F5_9CAUD|nr:XerC Integrase [uncultured Caudovirales phage]